MLKLYELIKQNLSLFIGIAFTMIVVPYTMFNQMAVIVACLVCLSYTIWMKANNKSGHSLILIALALTLPAIIRETGIFMVGLRWVPLFLEAGITILSLMDYYQKKANPIKGVLFLCIIFFFIFFIYSSNLSARYIRGIVDAIIFFHLLFYICYNDKMSFEKAYIGFSFIFVLTAIYAIMHYFFNKGPYMAFLDRSWGEMLGYVYLKRAAGLLGNSLVLCTICALYHAIILIRLLLTKKINYLLEALCLLTGLITISRTVLLVFLLQFLILLLFNKMARTGKMAVGLIAALLLINLSGVDFGIRESFSIRMETTTNSHRESGYSTTWEIFSVHPLGVGKQKLSQYIHEYNTGGISEELVTLDNFYLTQIASFGIFSMLIFPFYLVYFYKCPKKLMNKKYKQALYFIIITWCITGFSFDLESFNQVTAFCFGSLAVFYRVFSEDEISGNDGIVAT